MKLLFGFTFPFLPSLFVIAQNVGVGTTAPATKLHVQKGNSNGSVLSTSTIAAESNGTNWIHLLNPNANDAGIISGTNLTTLRSGIVFDTDSAIRFRAGGNFARMYISNTGNVGINTTLPSPSAILQVNSTTKGFLMPRMTTAQRKAIVDPEPGLLVFDLDKGCLFLWDGAMWSGLLNANANELPAKETLAPSEYDYGFGSAVSISGSYAIIGSKETKINGRYNQGAAYVFMKTGGNWVQQAKLFDPNGDTDDFFGCSVSIDGNYAIVGANKADTNIASGFNAGCCVYLFVRTGTAWTEQAKLFATDMGSSYEMGSSVSISGSYAIAGSTRANVGGNANQGCAYLFVRSGSFWTQQAKIIASDGQPQGRFGSSVAIDGNYCIVGAPGANIGVNNRQGAAYVFTRSGTAWTEQAKLVDADGKAFDDFGSSVSISGSYALVGAREADHLSTPNAGAAYIFARNNTSWSQHYKIGPPVDADSFFGWSVSLDGDYAVIGSPGGGATYVYKRADTFWSRVRKLDNLAGMACAISGFNIVYAPDNTGLLFGKVFFLNFE